MSMVYVVYEDGLGIARCGECDAELVCDKNGDMPLACSKCGEKLDYSLYDMTVIRYQ